MRCGGVGLALLGALSCGGANSSSGACLTGDALGPPLVTPSAQLGGMACATDATPDAVPSLSFQLDTGGNFVGQNPGYEIGGNYGQPSCPDQFLAEFDLVASSYARRNVFIVGGWSVLTPVVPCGYSATMTVWGFDGSSTWFKFDQITFQGQSLGGLDGGTFCQPVATSREIQTDLGGTVIAAGTFARARVAVVASDCGHKLPIDIYADEE